MTEGLEQAAGERWTNTDELLRTLIGRVDLVWRQLVVNAGGDAPDPIEVLRPGEQRKKASNQGFGALARSLLRGR
ncbi:MAG: hypothetical protein EKK62_07660 [Acidimicrobiia bacterium]|nr:MAG: hypothetical protein EKK62_07660 [Acidimicrobiia bacterium]